MIFFSLEVVGRFPRKKEAEEMSISEDVPVWLPVGPFKLQSDILAKIKQTRKAVNNPINRMSLHESFCKFSCS